MKEKVLYTYTTRWIRDLQHHDFDFDEKMLYALPRKRTPHSHDPKPATPGGLLLRAVSFYFSMSNSVVLREGARKSKESQLTIIRLHT